MLDPLIQQSSAINAHIKAKTLELERLQSEIQGLVQLKSNYDAVIQAEQKRLGEPRLQYQLDDHGAVERITITPSRSRPHRQDTLSMVKDYIQETSVAFSIQDLVVFLQSAGVKHQKLHRNISSYLSLLYRKGYVNRLAKGIYVGFVAGR